MDEDWEDDSDSDDDSDFWDWLPSRRNRQGSRLFWALILSVWMPLMLYPFSGAAAIALFRLYRAEVLPRIAGLDGFMYALLAVVLPLVLSVAFFVVLVRQDIRLGRYPVYWWLRHLVRITLYGGIMFFFAGWLCFMVFPDSLFFHWGEVPPPGFLVVAALGLAVAALMHMIFLRGRTRRPESLMELLRGLWRPALR